MKILILSSIGYEGGGAETTITLLRRKFEAFGHTVLIVASDLGPTEQHFSDREFHACAGRSLVGKTICRVYNRSACRVVRDALRDFKPDIVQVHTTYEVSPAVLFVLRRYPVILVTHGAEDYTKELLLWGFPPRFFLQGNAEPQYRDLTLEGKFHYWYHMLLSVPVYRYLLRYVSRVLVVSEYMRAMLARQGIRSVCIPNAVALPRSVPLDPASKTILYAGRLEKLKGLDYLLDALPVVCAKVPEARLVVVGTGTYTKELRQRAEQLGVTDRIAWIGHVSQDALNEYYASAALVVMPSVWPEPFGKVGVEAMAVGRPVVACDVGGVQEWLSDEVTGFLVPPKDADALARRITQLLSDERLRIKMGRAATEEAKRFSIEHFCKALISLHNTCMAERARKQ
ncbi:MAG: glycosyltransferase family 4 protein [Candidatus Pacebacteria bacterium]|nr:glycosyltransferase family 4 protein [Candidatus Paceibacterota bacterium]